MPTSRRPTAVAVLAVSAIVFSAGGAYAYWTASGTGVGTVSVAMVKPLVIEQLDVLDLAVGRTADLTARVTNPNDFEASLLATVITVKVTADADHKACDVRNFEVTAPSTKAKLIEANGSLALEKGSITLLNTTLDQAACHGATLTLDYLLERAPSSPTPPVTADPAIAPTAVPTDAPTVSATDSAAAPANEPTTAIPVAPTAAPFTAPTTAPFTAPTAGLTATQAP